MKPQSIGRALGIGLRVAGRMAGQRVASGAQASPKSSSSGSPAHSAASLAASRSAGQAAGKATRGVARGFGGFLRPFGRVGGILWLEVTGVFFFLFAVVFGFAMWRTKPGGWSGPFARPFIASAALLLVFLYLGASSFWRARRK